MAKPRGSQASNITTEDDVTVSTFSQSSKDMHVRVEKPAEGYLCTLSMLAHVPLPPDQLYELLVNPEDCMRIFKSLKQVHHRRILSDDGQGNRTVEVDQTGAWRFLMFRGTFTVRMIVEQRKLDRSIHFRLARSGFMRDFTGTWLIRPFDNVSLDQLVNKHNPTPLHRLQSGLRAMEHSLGLGGQQQESLVQLQQSIAPALAPPQAVTKLLQRIAAKQITRIMADLQVEAQRINRSSESSSSSGGNRKGGALIGHDSSSSGSSSENVDDTSGQQTAGRWKGRKQRRHDQQQASEEALDKKQLTAHVSDLR